MTPGFCDDHTHPVIGDFTPRQLQVDFIDSYLHGGTTTMVSAGEPHTPGRPTDPAGVKALAISGAQVVRQPASVGRQGACGRRPAGARADRGRLPGDGRGRRHAGRRDRISGVKDAAVAAEMTRWAQACGMRVMVHTGGASIAGSGIVGADFVVQVQPDVAGHVNGGPTALPLDHVERILDETSARVEIVHNGNVKAAGEVAALVARQGGARPPGDRHRQPCRLGSSRSACCERCVGGVPGRGRPGGGSRRCHGKRRGAARPVNRNGRGWTGGRPARDGCAARVAGR